MSKPSLRGPRGTRDYFPAEMAVRLHVEHAWRSASLRHGFEEIEGPNFEHLELFTLKSGQEIVSELFSFRREGGDDTYALRPEFTPTLARMVASKGSSLSRPIKWFAIPSHFRAERPQRGRVREFRQWNVDMLGLDSESADAEVIATAIGALASLGLGPDAIRVKVSHRDAVAKALGELGVEEDRLTAAFELLDRRDKLDEEEFSKRATALNLPQEALEGFDKLARTTTSITEDLAEIAARAGIATEALGPLEAYRDALVRAGVAEYCDWDLGIVRGLAYYTGGVFEIHDADGTERAIAGGGRYDGLVELLGGPPTSAVGMGMGDIVLSLVLEKRGLLKEIAPSPPEIFLLSAGEDGTDERMIATMHALRNAGMHARRSYKTTRNVGKLLSEAAKSGAKLAIIFGEECAQGRVVVKDLGAASQEDVAFDDLKEHLDRLLTEQSS